MYFSNVYWMLQIVMDSQDIREMLEQNVDNPDEVSEHEVSVEELG